MPCSRSMASRTTMPFSLKRSTLGLYAELESRDAKLIAGGAAQNTARADSVVYFGCVGKDKYAETLLQANKKPASPSDTDTTRLPQLAVAVLLSPATTAACATDLAAANCYKIDHLKENWDVVEKSKAYFVGGYHLTVCVPAVLALAEEACQGEQAICSLALCSIHSPVLQGPS
ncbi:hypothetical protein MRB53_041128 [Persea americana]|nr:hypothetical protein MRB53_041128 [Persea americana]